MSQTAHLTATNFKQLALRCAFAKTRSAGNLRQKNPSNAFYEKVPKFQGFCLESSKGEKVCRKNKVQKRKKLFSPSERFAKVNQNFTRVREHIKRVKNLFCKI